MTASGADDFRWNLGAGFSPPGGYYKGLPVWAWSQAVHERALDLLVRHAPPPARVLDLGAGSGAFCQRLLDSGYKDVEAVERRAEDFAVAGVKVHALNLDSPFAEKLKAPPADAATALEVVEHLENPWAFARECARLLKPGGVLVVSTPNVESARSRVEFLLAGEFRYFTREDYERIGHRTALFSRMVRHVFESAGFEFLERTFDANLWPRAPKSPRKALRWLLHWATWPFMRGDKRGEVSLVAFRRRLEGKGP